LVLLELWKLDVNGSTHTGTEVGWAGGDVTQVGVVLELGDLLNLLRGNGESLEDLTDVGALLHGDDSELILLIDPDEEGLGIVVVDTTGLWPLSLKTAGLEVLVSTLEEEVISDELLSLRLSHVAEREVFTLKITVELGKSGGNLALDLSAVSSGDLSTERVVSEVSSNTDSGGVDHGILISGEGRGVQSLGVHVKNVLGVGAVTVVHLDDLVEERGELIVRVVATSVDTDTRVGPFSSREDSLLESVAVLVNSIFALFPNVLGEALGKDGSSSTREVWESLDVLGSVEVSTHHGTLNISFGEILRMLLTHS
jgi:hypothetical protein